MKQDIHERTKYLERKIQRIKDDKFLSERNKEIILKYLNDSSLGKTVRKGQKREISDGRNLQVAGYLMRMAKDWFKKDLDTVTQKDMEEFISKLKQGQISISERIGKKIHPYSSETKTNIKKFIRKFYKWLLTDNRHFPDLVEWIDTSRPETLVPAIKGLDKGVEKIIDLIPDIKKKALIYVCFDSGFREGEILSCKITDAEKRPDGVYYLRCRESKTKLRTVSLPLSSKLLDRWLEEHPDRNNPNADLWQCSRIMFYKAVTFYGQKALKTHITVHMLRHTSATYWATRLDRTTFCQKFGWSYSSKSPDRYIDFAKVSQDKVIDIAKSEQLSDISKKLSDTTLENQILKDRITALEKQAEEDRQFKEDWKKIFKNKDLREKIDKIL